MGPINIRTRFLLALAFATVTVCENVAAGENIACGVGVVVIDPGHGGKIPGAHYGGVYEKQIVLQVALKLGKLIEQGMPGVEVVYTRKTDRMIGSATTRSDDLQQRATIANKAAGELFLSIHANAAKATSARGVEVLVMGETPKEQQYNTNALYESNREDLIDLSTEPDAPIVRARIQNMQFTYGEYSMAIARCIERNFRAAGRSVRGIKPQLLRVLYATDMPGVLAEIGFMSNPQEMAYMKSEKGQNEIARNLYQAVRDYSDYVLNARGGDQSAATAATVEAPAPEAKPAAVQPALRYAVQVLSSAKPVGLRATRFKSYRGKVKQFKGGGSLPYKYCVGPYDSRAEAQRQRAKIRKVFPDAFVVSCRGTEIAK